MVRVSDYGQGYWLWSGLVIMVRVIGYSKGCVTKFRLLRELVSISVFRPQNRANIGCVPVS
jgi:hypothetical protein